MLDCCQIRDEKLQYHINTEAAKISALSLGKSDKYKYFTGKEILPPDQSRIIEQAKFTYPPLGKALKNKQNQLMTQLKKKQKQPKIDQYNKFQHRSKISCQLVFKRFLYLKKPYTKLQK